MILTRKAAVDYSPSVSSGYWGYVFCRARLQRICSSHRLLDPVPFLFCDNPTLQYYRFLNITANVTTISFCDSVSQPSENVSYLQLVAAVGDPYRTNLIEHFLRFVF
jgi:hypothetical protein